MTTEELGFLFPIELQAFSANWAKLYETEKGQITCSFSQNEIIAIDHIGSTAIPGIKAKPIIDILLQVSENIHPDNLKSQFTKLGYECIHKPDPPLPTLCW